MTDEVPGTIHDRDEPADLEEPAGPGRRRRFGRRRVAAAAAAVVALAGTGIGLGITRPWQAAPTTAGCSLAVLDSGTAYYQLWLDGMRFPSGDSMYAGAIVENRCPWPVLNTRFVVSGLNTAGAAMPGESTTVTIPFIGPDRQVALPVVYKFGHGLSRPGQLVGVRVGFGTPCWVGVTSAKYPTWATATDVRWGLLYSPDPGLRGGELLFNVRWPWTFAATESNTGAMVFRSGSGVILAAESVGDDDLIFGDETNGEEVQNIWIPPAADLAKTQVFLWPSSNPLSRARCLPVRKA